MSHKQCARATEQVYLFLDSEMTRWRYLRVKRHLKKCPPCCSKFDFETHLRLLVREKSREEAPPELIDRLRALLREHGASGA